VERFVVIARLKPGGRDRADELIAQYKSGEDVPPNVERIAIFLAEGEIIFALEGIDVPETMRSILNDPVRSTWLSPWLPLLDGPLHATAEAYYWERS
jgi:hypothetical protein